MTEPDPGRLAIIAAAGRFPVALAEAVTARGRDLFVVMLDGLADPALSAYPHAVVGLGQFGGMVRAARGAGCRDIVFLGSLVRPNLWKTIPDFKSLLVLPEIIRLYRGGDNHLLSGIATIFEREGFRLLGAQEVAPEMLMPVGALTRRLPDDVDLADIAHGLSAIATLGPFDIGQALVLGAKRIVAVEGAEGTDGLLERTATMRAAGRLKAPLDWGIMVKAPKPGQDRRLDLPAVGPGTIERAAAAGLRGVAVAAGSTLIVDAQAMIATADRAGLFLYGAEAKP